MEIKQYSISDAFKALEDLDKVTINTKRIIESKENKINETIETETYTYCVHADEDANNLDDWFNNEEEAIEYCNLLAKEQKVAAGVIKINEYGEEESIYNNIELIDEAFKSKNKKSLKESEAFNIKDTEDLKAAREELNAEEEAVEQIIDVNAEAEEDLQDSYIGKFIIQCPNCHSLYYKAPEEIEFQDHEKEDEEETEEEKSLVNISEKCPICGNEEGYIIIGKVAPLSAEGEEFEEEPEAEPEPEVNPETEFKDAEIFDDDEPEPLDVDEKGNVIEPEDKKSKEEKEPKEYEPEEDEPEEDEPEEDEPEEDEPEEDEPEEEKKNKEKAKAKKESLSKQAKEKHDMTIKKYKLESLDENTFDNLTNKFIKRTYANVDSYTTNNIYTQDNKLIVEGIIKFKSGKTQTSKYIFEGKEDLKSGKMRYTGMNEIFSTNKGTFKLIGSIKKGNFISESLSYKYQAKLDESKTKDVVGKIRLV